MFSAIREGSHEMIQQATVICFDLNELLRERESTSVLGGIDTCNLLLMQIKSLS